MEEVEEIAMVELEESKGHHSFQLEKVNLELQDENKRLKIYIAELRTALVEAQRRLDHQIINSPTDIDIMEQGALNTTALSSEKNLELSSEVFTNDVILDNLFGYLGIEKLKKCRLVSKKWNENVSSILRKANNGNGVRVNIFLLYRAGKTGVAEQQPTQGEESEEDTESEVDDEDNLFNRGHELVRVQELYSIVKNGPKDWFKGMNLRCSGLENTQLIRVFEDFGNRLKVVRIGIDNLQVQQLQKILIDWCPNIQELELAIGKHLKGEAAELNIPPTKSLNLTHLSFNAVNRITVSHITSSEILFTILTSSPHLKTLEFLGNSTFCYSYTSYLFSKLQPFPDIVGNLERIFIPNAVPRSLEHDDPLKDLSEIEFKSKLKQFVSTSIIQEDGIALSSILSKSTESLEKLTLTSRRTKTKVPRLVPYRLELRLELSEMKNLHEFKYFAHKQFLMSSIDVIAKMPNLKVFMLGFDHPYSLTDRKWDVVDDLFSNCEKLLATPHTSLKELYIFGFIRDPATTFGLINELFPNLNKMGVSIRPIRRHEDPEGCYYDDFFKGISELKHLSRLYLEWKDALCDKPYQKFMKGFCYLKNLEKLMYLTVRTGCGIKDFEEVLFEAIPKLKRLKLVDISMRLVDAQKCLESLSERNVVMEVKDDYFRKTDSYSFEWDTKINHITD